MTNSDVFSEVRAIFNQWPIWFMLGSQDIKMRYRRSAIGPFWITISMLVTILSMGLLYGHLFKINLANYFPYLASGVISWTFLSNLITESSNAFIEADPYIKNQESFLSLFIMRLILRNFIIFLHNILVFLPIIVIFHIGISFKIFQLIPGLLVICVNGMLWGSLLAIIGTRYRDFAQIITSLIQVIFFLTPIMWTPTLLPEHLQWVVLYNPFNQFLNLLRDPLMNNLIKPDTIFLVLLTTLLGVALYMLCVKKFKNRIVFWL